MKPPDDPGATTAGVVVFAPCLAALLAEHEIDRVSGDLAQLRLVAEGRPEDVFINVLDALAKNWSVGHGIAQFA